MMAEDKKKGVVCNIDDPFDAWISFRIPMCNKKQIDELIKRRKVRNKSDAYRLFFFSGFEKEYGV